jgi:hypothetical protein
MGEASGSGVGGVGVERKRGPKKPAVAGPGKASCNRGDVAEMQFMIQASNKGFGVAKPFGNNTRYDVILDAGRPRLLRVQVKGSGCWRANGFSVDTCWRTSRGREPYYSGANRLSGGGLQRAESAWAADLVRDSGAGSGRAIEHQVVSVWKQAGWTHAF